MNTLKNRLHELVDGENGSAPPIDRLIQRGRRARRRRHATTLALSVLAAGALTVVALPPQRAEQPPPPVIQAVSPQVGLVAALANSENTSFKVRVTDTRGAGMGRETTNTEGAFDPATTTGYLRILGEDQEIRLIDGVKYYYKGMWVQFPGRYESIGYDTHLLDGKESGTADSERLFQILRRADAVITKTGELTYHFDAPLTSSRAVGDIVLDRDGRVAKVTYEWGPEQPRFTKVLEFSDYGTPVTVERPANAVKPG